MSPENFVYWLQGYLELSNADDMCLRDELTSEQVKMIKSHLNSVLTNITRCNYMTNTSHVICGDNVAIPSETIPSPIIANNMDDFPLYIHDEYKSCVNPKCPIFINEL